EREVAAQLAAGLHAVAQLRANLVLEQREVVVDFTEHVALAGAVGVFHALHVAVGGQHAQVLGFAEAGGHVALPGLGDVAHAQRGLFGGGRLVAAVAVVEAVVGAAG
nr:hypothetical protein [Tanacetum cinerariifolium]